VGKKGKGERQGEERRGERQRERQRRKREKKGGDRRERETCAHVSGVAAARRKYGLSVVWRAELNLHPHGSTLVIPITFPDLSFATGHTEASVPQSSNPGV
jgi:hypothetical protein